MERIREVVKINGRPVSISDNLSKSDFQTGDIVIISFHKSHFEGVVDFSREEEATSNCSSGQRCRVSVSPASSSSQIALCLWVSIVLLRLSLAELRPRFPHHALQCHLKMSYLENDCDLTLLPRPVEKGNPRGRKHRKPGMIYVLVMS